MKMWPSSPAAPDEPRYKLAVQDQRPADARTQEESRDMAAAGRGAELLLAVKAHVGVVFHRGRDLEELFQFARQRIILDEGELADETTRSLR